MGDGLIGRMLRALRLDPTLYREVAAPGASTQQATAVVALAAVGTGAALAARDILPVAWGIERYGGFEGEVRQAVYLATVIAIVHVAAWPLWAFGVRLAGARIGDNNAEAPEFGHVARAIAFAQAPGVLGLLFPVFVVLLWGVITDIESVTVGARIASVYPIAAALRALISGWVLVGTFLAVRQTMGLSNGRTLGTIFTVGVASAALLVLITIAIILVSKGVVAAFDLYPDWVGRDSWAGPRLFAYGFGIPVAQGLEFNLGLMVNSMAMNLVAPLAPALIP